MNDMHLRAGFVSQISGGLSGQNRLFGTVGCQKDPGGEDTRSILLCLATSYEARFSQKGFKSTKKGQAACSEKKCRLASAQQLWIDLN
jgi:hypothetical protein